MITILKRKINFLLTIIFRKYKIGSRVLNSDNFILEGEILAKLDIPDGLFYIDTKSKLIGSVFIGSYEKNIYQILKKVSIEESEYIVNVGANIGIHLVGLSKKFSKNRLIAIEPNPEAFVLLKKNIFINGISDRVLAYNSCVSSDFSEIVYNYIPGKSEFSSLRKIIPEYSKNQNQISLKINSYPLEYFTKNEKVGLILMDVEGAENLIIEGALDMIRRNQPIIIMECADKLLKSFSSSSYEIVTLLRSLGYKVLFLDNKFKFRNSSVYNGTILAFNETKSHFNSTKLSH